MVHVHWGNLAQVLRNKTHIQNPGLGLTPVKSKHIKVKQGITTLEASSDNLTVLTHTMYSSLTIYTPFLTYKNCPNTMKVSSFDVRSQRRPGAR